MSTPIQMKITAAGRAAQLSINGSGFDLVLTHIQFGSGRRSPDGSETALVTPQQFKSFAAGSKPTPTQLRVSVVMPGTLAYAVNEVGVWKGEPGTPGAVLYAYWSSPSQTITNMAVGQDLALSFDFALEDSASAVAVVVDPVEGAWYALLQNHESAANPHQQYLLRADLATQAQAEEGADNSKWISPLRARQAIDKLVPAASETVVGKSRFATNGEALQGSSKALSVHPAALVATIGALVPKATDATQGKVELATNAETVAGSDTERAVVPAGVAAAILAHKNGSDHFAAGTRMLFAHGAAPTGWVQVTDDGANNRMLRVVVGGGAGYGGKHDPAICSVVPAHTHGFWTGGQSANHVHSGWTGGQDSDHTHWFTVPKAFNDGTNQGLDGAEYTEAGPGVRQFTTSGISNGHRHYFETGTVSSDHAHSGATDNGSSQTNWEPRFLNLILCQKS